MPMPRIATFDFTNRPTFLFFRWVRDGSGRDPAVLIAEAFDDVAGELSYQIDGNVCRRTRPATAT